MTVSELIEKLSKFPPDMEVFVWNRDIGNLDEVDEPELYEDKADEKPKILL